MVLSKLVSSSRNRRLTAGLGVVIVSVAILAGTTTAAMGAQDEGPAVATKSAQDFPQNASGMRFGSGLEARTPGDEPDLILAYGTKGQLGYIRKIDVQGPIPKSPAEAAALSKQQQQPKSIPLYAEDGKTVVGVFILS